MDELDIEYEELSVEQKVYTVSELNRRIKFMLEAEFPSITLEAEISNFKHHSSGHMYMSLKDEGSQIGAVFFRGANQRVKFEIKDGLKVIVFGKVSVYQPRGQYQVYIERVEPQGVGSLQLAFMQLKEKLLKEGLFDAEHKKEIPRFPSCVGIITSPTGAAIRDMIHVLKRRFSGLNILLFPVRVQGDLAAGEIAEAIKQMNQLPEVDVLIVGRGGGSLEDLWPFNEEIVARAIYGSRIPVISAVGHETDWTISDMVADLRAPTPSAAAEVVIQSSAEIARVLRDSQDRISYAIRRILESYSERLKSLSSSYALKQPRLLVEQQLQRLDELVRQLVNYSEACFEAKQNRFREMTGKLHAMSPLGILSRGYSVTLNSDGECIKDVNQVKVGNSITTIVTDGSIQSKVISANRKKGANNGN